MSRSVDDMIGARFGLLTVEKETRHPHRQGRFYECRCQCGSLTVAYGGHLRNGSRTGCGCIKPAHRTHGMSGTPEYKAWECARSRCHNPSNRKYPLYGGRGIRMCAEWMHSFEIFFAEVGPRPAPGLSLDRIDGERGYEPGNCRWATIQQQNINRRQHRPKKMGVRRVTSG